jgi:catechol 2,3-dioxygenase-like lactoylglutathione lyase family enzyme
MERVTGIGGIFITCSDPAATREWYHKHLGIVSEAWGAVFPWREHDHPEKTGSTVLGVFRRDTEYFAPSTLPFMVNFRVRNLAAMLEALRAEGVEILGHTEDEQGKFAWVMDPDGIKIELWEDTGH